VTFLFTDIEGSTRRWESDADAMRAALLAHDEVLRSAIEAHGGYLFSRTGDGVVAAFASPRSAVDAAIAAQRSLELPVRMGIATGEAELRDGDYFGTVLNRAAILAALFDHLGKHQQAATISGFAATAMTRASYPQIITTITHLREVLGDKTYESLAGMGETMTTAAMVTYAYDQISQTQLELTPTSLSK
jgi:hypothetical protein